jgi:HB1, ASXL, restriction endonuclease HTH domain
VGAVTYLEAAIKVLKSSRRPLSTNEIVERAIARGLTQPTGKTPAATMSAVLYRHLGEGSQLRQIAEPGPRRAVRGTVRWTLSNN